MKFNEKLMMLRKKEGLSQEELGYKLNVTRQTVSKWELGETTPEMDKLIEIGKTFNISVDELINETETTVETSESNPVIEDQPIGNLDKKNNKIIIIIVVALIAIIVFGIIRMFTAFSIFNKATDEITDAPQGFFEKIFSLFDKAIDAQENMLENETNNQENIMNDVENIFGNATNKINKTAFNGKLELYQGSITSTSLKQLLDQVITINKTEERKITVKYLETETQDANEIKNLKLSLKDSNNFEVSFEYDEEGYIYEAKIEKVISQFEINKFNNSLEIFAGTKMGGSVVSVLDNIITSNKTKERKITVKYNKTETQDEDEIKSIKRKIETFDDYEITYEYDEDGFINEAKIEKI